MRSPRATEGCVALSVVSGVMCHGNDELAILPGKLLEKLSLQKLDVDNRERAAAALRGKDVAVADGNSDLDRFYLGFS